MDESWKQIIWQQFGAAIDMLGNALHACPDGLWRARLWETPSERSEWGEFWYIAFHTLFWLDYYLDGATKGFAPPPPFTLDELDPAGVLPERPYTREELLGYLAHGRRKCRETIEALTGPAALRTCSYPWGQVSFAELLLYNMRHVQEHAAQLNLLLGQELGSGPGWVGKAR